MNLKLYRNQFVEKLTVIYDSLEAESFFYLILEDKHQLKKLDLALNPDLSLTNSEIEIWDSILKQLLQEIPIQYILGKTSFYGLEFEVDKNVLIPRPETEELVDWIVKRQNLQEDKKSISILDMGTGSGCIAISLAKNLSNAIVYALDISEKALAVAKNNAAKNQVEVQFIQTDLLETSNLKIYQKFDIIVSNPPYVRNLEKQEIHNNVLNHEPHLALFVEDNNALIFFEKIADFAKTNLSENGQLFFEINQYLGKEMIDLLQKNDFKNIELRKDIYGNERMIRAEI